jgi:hypothetical protein
MTSEPDSTARRRPPTIDLTATEVETEKPEKPEKQAQEAGGTTPADDGMKGQAAPREHASRNFAGGLKPHAIGAVAGAIVMAAIVVGLWLAGLVPLHNAAPAANAQRPDSTAVDQISARLEKIQQALQAPRPEPGLASRISAVEAQSKTLGDSLAALNRRLDDIAVMAKSALARADAAAAASEAAKGAAQAGVQRSDMDALASRIAALEREAKTLSDDVARHASSIDDRAARLSVAAEALRAAVERDAPYKAELAAVKSLGAEQNAMAPLEPFAAGGVPSATELAHQLSQLTLALLRASGAAPRDGSFLGRIESNAQRLVRITPIDAPAGDEPSAVIARINADAARADIAAALADIARLPEAAKTLAKPWVEKVDARNAAVAASRRIAADALAALGKPNAQ